MDVPSPSAGTVKDLKVKVGDRVSKGNLILLLDSAGEAKAAPAAPSGGNGQSAASTQAAAPAPKAEARGDKQKQPEEERPKPGEAPGKTEAPSAKPAPKAEAAKAPPAAPIESEAFKRAHASPSVRKFARELGVDLSQVKGSGPKARILQEDVQSFVKQAISGGAAPAGAPAGGGGLTLLRWPQVDFTKCGPVEAKPLSRIKKIAGANLARNWVMI